LVRTGASRARCGAFPFRTHSASCGNGFDPTIQDRLEREDRAARQEHLILNAEAIASRKRLAAALDRYARKVSPSKRGARWEIVRLGKLARDRIAKIPLAELSAADLADWRDRRMREVSAGTVLREITLLSAVLTQCRREWGLIASNPMADVRKPSQPAARTRRVSQDELDRLAHSAGDDLSTATARAFHAFLFAIETGMRAGEILGLRPGDVEGRVAHLPRTKNGSARDVPLSTEALRLRAALPPCDPLFGLTTGNSTRSGARCRTGRGCPIRTFATAATKPSRDRPGGSMC
jgi:integrase